MIYQIFAAAAAGPHTSRIFSEVITMNLLKYVFRVPRVCTKHRGSNYLLKTLSMSNADKHQMNL
jgi:hypothetical protein